jgi:hypothetical protein
MISDRKLRKLVSTDKKNASTSRLQGPTRARTAQGPRCRPAAGEGAGRRGHGWRGLRGRRGRTRARPRPARRGWRRRRRARPWPERAARPARASIRVIWASLRNGDRFPSLMRQTHLTSGPNVDRVQQSHAGCPCSQNQLAKPPEGEGVF